MNKTFASAFLQIPNIDKNCRFWMLRTNNGMYFDEFIRERFVAIGWNLILSDDFPLTYDGQIRINTILRNPQGYDSKTPTTVINKCERFCKEIKEGDIALITDKNRIAFAVIGEYYEEQKQLYTMQYELSAENGNIKISGCPYCKRRKIEIIHIIDDKERINPYMYKAILLNKHSLCSMDKYADIILSSCYDAYVWNNKFTMSFRVETKREINAVTLAKFIDKFNTLLPNVSPNDIYVKTSLNSPGDVVLQIANWIKENYLWVFVLWVFIFGGKYGEFEMPSVWNVIKYFLERSSNKKMEALEIENKQLLNLKLYLEIDALKSQPDKRKIIENAAAEISDAANKLEINSLKNKDIDLPTIMSEIDKL